MGCLATLVWYIFETLMVFVFHALLTAIAKVGFRRVISLCIFGAIIWWIASASLG